MNRWRRGVGERAWPAAVACLCVLLLAPLLLVSVPPLLDYPNHLARIFVLASLPHDPVLAQFYAAHWTVIPNLALDLVGPPLVSVLPVHVAGRLLIAVSVLLPVLGAIAYHRALGGRWWSLGVGLVAYNGNLLAGFLNFEIAVGLALLLAAAWLRWRETRPALAIGLALVGAPVLFFCHLMGVVLFGLLIGGEALSRGKSGLPRRLLVLALIFAGPAVLYAMSDLRALGGDAQFVSPADKLRQLVAPFVNYNWTLDVVTACAAVGLLTSCLVMRLGRMPGPAAIASAGLLAAYLAAPFAWKGTFALDTRFVIMLGYMLFAGFVPRRWPGWLVGAAVAVLVPLFAVRMGLLAMAWSAYAGDVADLRVVLAPVQPGQAVYVAEAGPEEGQRVKGRRVGGWRRLSNGWRIDEHLGALVLIEQRAYWPFQFDIASQQPLETRPRYRALAERVGSLPNRGQAAIADVCGFDYVLLTEADAVPPLPEARFRLLRQSGFAALYDITKCKEGP